MNKLQKIWVQFDRSNKQKVVDLFKKQFALPDGFELGGEDNLEFETQCVVLCGGELFSFFEELKKIATHLNFAEFSFLEDTAFEWDKNDKDDDDNYQNRRTDIIW